VVAEVVAVSYDSGPETVRATSPSDVFEAIERLERVAEMLRGKSGPLRERLDLLLRPSEPSKDDDARPQSPASSLAGRLEGVNGELQGVSRLLSEVLARLDLP
jgi:hypothetical protein